MLVSSGEVVLIAHDEVKGMHSRNHFVCLEMTIHLALVPVVYSRHAANVSRHVGCQSRPTVDRLDLMLQQNLPLPKMVACFLTAEETC